MLTVAASEEAGRSIKAGKYRANISHTVLKSYNLRIVTE